MVHREENLYSQTECIFSVLDKFAFSGGSEMFFVLSSWGLFHENAASSSPSRLPADTTGMCETRPAGCGSC